jgi:hypothetical protein
MKLADVIAIGTNDVRPDRASRSRPDSLEPCGQTPRHVLPVTIPAV